MASLWPHKPHTFRALARIYGPMWLRCDVCPRYARLKLAGLTAVDSRTKTFSCSQCRPARASAAPATAPSGLAVRGTRGVARRTGPPAARGGTPWRGAVAPRGLGMALRLRALDQAIVAHAGFRDRLDDAEIGIGAALR